MTCHYRTFSELSCFHNALSRYQRPTRERCGGCEYYEPPGRIIRTCELWATTGEVCTKSYKECKTCPYYHPEGLYRRDGTLDHERIKELSRSRSRRHYRKHRSRQLAKNKSWVDQHRLERRQYMRDYMRKRRRKNEGRK